MERYIKVNDRIIENFESRSINHSLKENRKSLNLYKCDEIKVLLYINKK